MSEKKYFFIGSIRFDSEIYIEDDVNLFHDFKKHEIRNTVSLNSNDEYTIKIDRIPDLKISNSFLYQWIEDIEIRKQNDDEISFVINKINFNFFGNRFLYFVIEITIKDSAFDVENKQIFYQIFDYRKVANFFSDIIAFVHRKSFNNKKSMKYNFLYDLDSTPTKFQLIKRKAKDIYSINWVVNQEFKIIEFSLISVPNIYNKTYLAYSKNISVSENNNNIEAVYSLRDKDEKYKLESISFLTSANNSDLLGILNTEFAYFIYTESLILLYVTFSRLLSKLIDVKINQKELKQLSKSILRMQDYKISYYKLRNQILDLSHRYNKANIEMNQKMRIEKLEDENQIGLKVEDKLEKYTNYIGAYYSSRQAKISTVIAVVSILIAILSILVAILK